LQLSHTTEGKGVPVPPGASLLRQARRAAAATAIGGLVGLALLGAAPARAASPDPSPGISSPSPDPYPGAATRSTATSHPATSSTFVPAAGSVSSVEPTARVAPHSAPVVRQRASRSSRPAVTTHSSANQAAAVRKQRTTPRKRSPLLPFADLFTPARSAAAAAPVLATRAERNAVSAGLALAVAGVVLSSGLLLAGIAREVRL
jgi:hypothetical protein